MGRAGQQQRGGKEEMTFRSLRDLLLARREHFFNGGLLHW